MGLFDFFRNLFAPAPASEVSVPPAAPPPAAAAPPPALPSNPVFEEAIAEDPDDETAWQVYADWLLEQGVAWGEVITAAAQGAPDEQRQADAQKELRGNALASFEWDHGVITHFEFDPDADEEPMQVVLERVLRHPAGRLVRELRLRIPEPDSRESLVESLVKTIVKAGPLPCLDVLDLSPSDSSQNRREWRAAGDLTGLWKAAPRLGELDLHGGSGPSKLAPIDAPHLRWLSFQSDGLDESVPLELGAAVMPYLIHLELWLGLEEVGCTCTVDSLAGILAGQGLPRLKTLALKNSEEQGALIDALARSALLPRLAKLDLSMGVMAADGAAALVRQASHFTHLEQLNLDDNAFTVLQVKTLWRALPNAVFGTQKDENDLGERYDTLGE